MGFVDHQQASILVFEAHQFGQGSNIAVHAVNALGHQQNAPEAGAHFAQNRLEGHRVVVRKAEAAGLTGLGAFENAVVTERVVENQVGGLHPVTEQSGVGGVTAHHDQAVLVTQELGQISL